MKRAVLFLLLALSLGGSYAYGDERDERRDLRERRARIRKTLKRVQKCIATGDFEPCASEEDAKIRDLVIAYYLKKPIRAEEVDADIFTK